MKVGKTGEGYVQEGKDEEKGNVVWRLLLVSVTCQLVLGFPKSTSDNLNFVCHMLFYNLVSKT